MGLGFGLRLWGWGMGPWTDWPLPCCTAEAPLMRAAAVALRCGYPALRCGCPARRASHARRTRDAVMIPWVYGKKCARV